MKMAKAGKKSESKLVEIMRKFKEDKLENGKSHQPVTSREQAIAIGLPEAHKAGEKIAKKPKK